jgi:O-antigen biosynthesis protein
MRVAVGIHVHAEPQRLSETLAAVERGGLRHEYEPLLLPDGPDDPTVAALSGLSRLPQSGTRDPRGVPACFNRLVAGTATEVAILLESGAVPARGALDLLVDALMRDRRIGLAGPSTNHAWNEQRVFPHAAGGLAVELTAREAARRYRRQFRSLAPLYSLGDFCLAVHRRVVDTIGGADEQYGLGPCWEMEYNIRAARAGFDGIWVGAAYVWRAPFTERRSMEEQARFVAGRHRYQDSICALRLTGRRADYEPHCRGDECEHFAPVALMKLRRPLPAPGRSSGHAVVTTSAPAPTSRNVLGPSDAPLVSCVMPTRDRAEFALHAVELFRAQDYPNRELLIIDDGDDELASRLPQDPRIVYLRAPRGEAIGAKRNRACAVARGALIAQWDDDDWYGSRRLTAQLEPLNAARADITGLIAPLFFDLRAWRFWTVSDNLHRRLFRGDVHGGTLAYRREVWERLARYPETSLAEDAAFLIRAIRAGARLTRIGSQGHFIYLRHGSNAWRFDCGRFLDPGGWRELVEPPLPAADRQFYARFSSAAGADARASVRTPAPTTPMSKRTGADRGPLVTCVMPTRNRRPWVAQAILYFQRQDYPHRELLILDDGEDRVSDLVPDDPLIRYVGLEQPMILGEKRNRACELARGAIIAHWDDDDWQAPHRLSYQVADMEARGAELCGPGRVIFFEPVANRAWQYEYPAAHRSWVHGAAMCYRRELWERNRFHPVQVGEDTRFVWGQGAARPLVHSDHRFFAAVVHSGNTSRKLTSGSYWRAHPIADVRSLLGGDFDFYERVSDASSADGKARVCA